jgi:hypothetical protein
MFELFKIVWDLVVLRDAARKGQLHWRIWPIAFGFVLLEYCIALPAVVLYENHNTNRFSSPLCFWWQSTLSSSGGGRGAGSRGNLPSEARMTSRLGRGAKPCGGSLL